MPGSWMLERLDGETRSHHADADAELERLFSPHASSSHYLQFLTRAYGFEAPLEATLAMTPNLDLMVDLRERKRAGLLAQDLLALGLRPQEVSEVPQCLEVPQFSGAAEALGWMYVAERATLSHGSLRDHLASQLPRDIAHGSAYLSAYAGYAGARWRTFGAALDLVARHPAIADRVIRAAHEAFRVQSQWIREGHPTRPLVSS